MSYHNRRLLTINQLLVPSDQTDFPMVIAGTYPFFKSVALGGDLYSPNAYDVMFSSTSDGANPLKYERVSINLATGKVEIHLKIPRVKVTQIYTFTGNPAISADQSDPTQVWANGYFGVYHFWQDSGFLTSIQNSVNGLVEWGPGDLDFPNHITGVVGKIGSAFSSDGLAYFHRFATFVRSPPNHANPRTTQMWTNWTSAGGGHPFWPGFGWGDNTDNSRWYPCVGTLSDGTEYWAVEGANAAVLFGPAFDPLVHRGWRFIANVWNTPIIGAGFASTKNYIDGDPVLNQFASGGVDSGSEFYSLGGEPFSGTRWFGDLDEIRVSTVARNDDWIKTEYNNQSDPDGFYSFGPANPPRCTYGLPTGRLS